MEGGYFLDPGRSAADRPAERGERRTSSLVPARAPIGGRTGRDRDRDRSAMADGLLKPLAHPENSAWSSLLYPLRGAEAMAMIAAMGAIFWGFTILVPEYCLTVWDDASGMGVPSMGKLIILISALPALLLLPLALSYALQYLGRVLVSSATGDTVPPRTPDRNFNGFFHGLGPWLAWLTLGSIGGLLPLAGYALFVDPNILTRPLPLCGLVALGLPYSLVALMLSFLHDRPLAANPLRVATTLLRRGASVLPTCLRAGAVLGLGVTTFAAARLPRDDHFWVYIIAALGAWLIMGWVAIVVMRLLGIHYFHHKDDLKWHRERPRWGMAWRL